MRPVFLLTSRSGHMQRTNKFNAKGLYACVSCGLEHQKPGAKRKRQPCSCGGQIEYFGSHKEHRTFVNHVFLQKAGKIKRLEAHPRYELHVNGVTVGHYTADLQYQDSDTNQFHIKDAKGQENSRFNAEARLRMRIAEALYSFKVEVV